MSISESALKSPQAHEPNRTTETRSSPISFFSILTAIKQDLRFLKNHQIKINLIQKTVSRQGLIHMNQWLYVMVNPYKAP